jgi:excisionase family DNA binding protein
MEHFMTSEELAELLHVDPVTIRRLVTKGELSAFRIGADYRFAPSDLQDYLQRQRITARAQSAPSASNPLDQFAQMVGKLMGKHTNPAEMVNRFDRFTKRARHVLTLAQEEAVRFEHTYIGTEHLLLGLLREEQGVAAQVLRNLSIEIGQVRQSVEAIIGRGDRVPVSGEVRFTPRAKKVIELAVYEARRLRHQFVGTEHLLLGLVREGEGVAATVLESFGLKLDQVRAEILRVLREKQPEPKEEPLSDIPSVSPETAAPLAEGETGLSCSSCGTRCPRSYRYCFNCGQPLSREDSSQSEAG